MSGKVFRCAHTHCYMKTMKQLTRYGTVHAHKASGMDTNYSTESRTHVAVSVSDVTADADTHRTARCTELGRSNPALRSAEALSPQGRHDS